MCLLSCGCQFSLSLSLVPWVGLWSVIVAFLGKIIVFGEADKAIVEIS